MKMYRVYQLTDEEKDNFETFGELMQALTGSDRKEG